MSISCSKIKNIMDEEDIIDGIKRSIENGKFKIKKSESIIIKPNLMYYWDWTTGQTTSPILIGALIEYLRSIMPNDPEIIIGESDASAMKTRHAFKMLGYENLAKQKDVTLYNLSNDRTKKTTTINGKKYNLSFSEKLFDTDLFINVPKLKYHRLPKITGAMKNIFGAIAKPHKYSYHKDLHNTIVAANKIIKSDLIIVDGLVALGNKPKIMRTILTGEDDLMMDKACSLIMKINPNSVKYIKIAENEIKSKNQAPIITGDCTLQELIEEFPETSYWKQKILWSLQLNLVNIYSKIVGDTVPPILLEG